MCGNYEIIFNCARNHSGKVADYLRQYDFERIDPSTQPDISYFSVYGKCHLSDLVKIVIRLNDELKSIGVEIEIVKFGWMKDE